MHSYFLLFLYGLDSILRLQYKSCICLWPMSPFPVSSRFFQYGIQLFPFFLDFLWELFRDFITGPLFGICSRTFSRIMYDENFTTMGRGWSLWSLSAPMRCTRSILSSKFKRPSSASQKSSINVAQFSRCFLDVHLYIPLIKKKTFSRYCFSLVPLHWMFVTLSSNVLCALCG